MNKMVNLYYVNVLEDKWSSDRGYNMVIEILVNFNYAGNKR